MQTERLFKFIKKEREKLNRMHHAYENNFEVLKLLLGASQFMKQIFARAHILIVCMFFMYENGMKLKRPVIFST